MDKLDYKSGFQVIVEICGRIVKVNEVHKSPFSFTLEVGQKSDDLLPFLFGIFPLSQEKVLLENIEFDDFIGNIYITKLGDEIEIIFYNQPEELILWQKKVQKHNQEELIKSLAMKTNKSDLSCNILNTLGFMVFQKKANGFYLSGNIPNWFKLLFPNYNYSSLKFDLTYLFPFLEVFLPEAESIFQQKKDGKIVSGLWTKISKQNTEFILQATAIKDIKSNFIFLESISDRYPDKQKNIQKLREQSLSLTQLKKTEDALRDVLKYREQFISIFSHDIKGPIGGIYSLMELLIKEDDFMSSFKENHVHLFDVMYKDLRDLHEYANKLYDWSNYNFGNLKLDKSDTEMQPIMSNLILNLKDKVNEKNINIELDIEEGFSLTIDAVFFKNALYNLIYNAIKYSNSFGSIKISSYESDKESSLRIKDNGVGMSQDIIDSLYDFNSKVSNIGTRGEMGTGIGITIVKKIMDLHQAKIKIESVKGEGTLINLIFSK